jgi:MFS family permease
MSSARTATFHRQLAILMVVRVVEPLSITQLFAYINPMMSRILPPETDQSDIGKYSGLIEAAFATGSFLTMYQWGRLSDRIGRKPAIMTGLTGIAMTTLAFGLSGNFYMAIAVRLLGKSRVDVPSIVWRPFLLTFPLITGGALCGNASVIRAALGEITPPEAESWVYP